MNAMFGGPLAQAIGWALLHLLWQGVLVAAILAAMLALLQKRSANARYLASIGALVLIVVMSCVTAYRAYAPIRSGDSAETFTIAPDAASSLAATNLTSDPAVTPGRFAAIVAYAGSHMPQIVLVWLLGVTVLSARLALGWITAHRLADRYAHAVDEEWQRSMERIAATLRIHRTIRLLQSAAVEVPTVIGWLRPVVLLPVSTLSGLSLDQIEMILAHELAHIRRHDFIVNLLQSTVETLFFYQPAVWWISRRVRIEREHCCDDIAVAISGDPIRYARALTRFEELRLDNAQMVLAANGGSLVTRIRRLVGVDGETARWSSRWTAGAALLTVVAALLLGPASPIFAQHDGQGVTATPPPAAKKATPKADKGSRKCDQSGTQIEVVERADADTEADVDADKEKANDGEADTNSEQAPQAPAMVVAGGIPDGIAPMAAAASEAAMVHVAPAIAVAPMAAYRIARAHARGASADHRIDENHLTVDDLITLKSVGVTAKYIEEMRGAGLGQLSLNDLVELRAMGVTPKYVQEMSSVGYKNLSARDLVELRAQGVSPELVRELADAGYASLSVRDLVRLAASGVNADFIRDLKKYRSK